MEKAAWRPPVSDDKASEKHVVPRQPNAHLLPTLFDRLRDDEPLRSVEAPGEYTVTRSQMRKIIQRDLAFLLNTVNMEDLLDRKRHALAAGKQLSMPRCRKEKRRLANSAAVAMLRCGRSKSPLRD